MIKLQKIMSAVAMGAMLLSAAPALAAPTSTVTADEMLKVNGVSIGEHAGLGVSDVRVTMARIIRVTMGLLGIVAVVIVLIGGFTWMTAGGNEEKVGEAKKWIFAGIIGLAIILSAYAIASFVINNLVAATTQTP